MRFAARLRSAGCSLLLTAVVVMVGGTSAFAQTPPAPVRPGVGGVSYPRKIKDVKPVYPAEAQRARVQGVVIMEATIDPQGKVSDVVVKRSIPLLDQAALDAVRQWEFTPTIVDGTPRPVIMTVTVNFYLDGPGSVPQPPVPPPASSMIRLTSSRALDGVTTVWEITAEKAKALPRWNPESSPAPISTADAARIAVDWLKARNPQVERYELQSVTLSRVRRSQEIDFWYYQVWCFAYGVRSSDPRAGVVILPDETVVDPQIQRDPLSPAASPMPRQSPSVYQPGPANGVTVPRLLERVVPQYTPEAMRAKIQGTVLVECVVATDGSVHDARVVRSLDTTFGLDEEAIKAAKQWRFTPGTKDGTAVPVMVTIELTFTLKK